MAFRVVPPDTSKRVAFQYVNSDAGIAKKDGVHLVFRPLTPDEVTHFQDLASQATSFKVNRQAGRGFRDRGRDPRSDISYTTDQQKLREAKRERIKTALVDWKGFQDEKGDELPFSWNNFEKACAALPDLFDFADEQIDRIAEEAMKEQQGAEENFPTGPDTDSPPSTRDATA